jgi:hypothetical protein
LTVFGGACHIGFGQSARGDRTGGIFLARTQVFLACMRVVLVLVRESRRSGPTGKPAGSATCSLTVSLSPGRYPHHRFRKAVSSGSRSTAHRCGFPELVAYLLRYISPLFDACSR